MQISVNTKTINAIIALVLSINFMGCLSYSHYRYSHQEARAQALPEGTMARPGRIYFVSFPENQLDLSILGWHPTIGHAALVTKDGTGQLRQYDYGWFVGHGGQRPPGAIGYVDKSASYGAVTAKTIPTSGEGKSTNDLGVARLVLMDMGIDRETNEGLYGDRIEVWARDVDDVGVAERYMEQFADDRDRGSMLWKFWQVGGYRCGNITRQAFDAARGEGHCLDLLWGGFPGADAPSIGTEKTVYVKESK